jgi:outer membrane biosynthesis protein TonB
MALREKFGRLVLLDETEASALGREYRAARLGPAGLDRLVTVLRFAPEVSSNTEATRRLTEEARLAARLQSPGLVRVLGIGRVEQSFYVSTELVEGRSVAAILDHCRKDAFPFAAEHALMIASRAASGIDSLHGKKDDAGAALVHGLIAPSRLVVAFDGEVKLKGLGLWPALRETGLLPQEERRYLAPEQLAGGAGEARSDVYALGLVLLEALTGRAPDGPDPLDGLDAARVTTASGEAVPLPKPLAALLRRALAPEPASRFGGASDLRRAVDALLFSGDFTPTTFDLAFFMHTLFRDDMERESRALEEARRGDYREFLVEEKPAAPAPDATTEVPAPTLVASARPTPPERPASTGGGGPDASGARAAASRAREAAARMTLGGAAAPTAGGRRGLWLLLGLLGAVIVGGTAGWAYFVRMRGPSRSSEEIAAAQARVRELETRIAQLEREKAEAEAKAAEDARTTLEAQAAAGGRAVDPATVERAQREARQRARAEQERRQQEELERLAAERTAEVQRLANEATPLPAQAPSLPAATPTPEAAPTATPAPAVPPASGQPSSPEQAQAIRPAGTDPPVVPPTASPVRRGALVDVNDPTVTPPVLVRQPTLIYPDLARQARVDAVVEIKALVDENGHVIEQVLVRCTRQNFRFEIEAERHVRGRRYQPAKKDGVAVRVWLPIVITFKFAR